jgi:hypothetical protein
MDHFPIDHRDDLPHQRCPIPQPRATPWVSVHRNPARQRCAIRLHAGPREPISRPVGPPDHWRFCPRALPWAEGCWPVGPRLLRIHFKNPSRSFLPLVISSSRFMLRFLIVIVFRANGASFLSPGHRPGFPSVGTPRAKGARYGCTPDHANPYRGPLGRRIIGVSVPGRCPGLRDVGPLGRGCCEFISTTPPVLFCPWRSRLRDSFYISPS